MADIVFNIVKGEWMTLMKAIAANSPANSALVVVPVDVDGTSDATIVDLDTLAAVLSAGVVEVSTNGWSRKVLTDADLTVIAADDTNNRQAIDVPDQVWTPTVGGDITDLIVGYDSDTTSGSDTNIIPLFILDCVVIGDGNEFTAQINPLGLAQAI